MKRISLDKDIKPLSEFRANASALIQQVKKTKRPLVITHHGRSVAVVIDVKEYEELLDKLEVLQDICLTESRLGGDQQD